MCRVNVIINFYSFIMSRSLLYWVIHKSIYTSLNTQSELSSRGINRHSDKNHSCLCFLLIFEQEWLLCQFMSLANGNILKILLQHCWSNIVKKKSSQSFCNIILQYATLKCCSNVATSFCIVRVIKKKSSLNLILVFFLLLQI